MPYIDQARRKKLINKPFVVLGNEKLSVGDMNFLINYLILAQLYKTGQSYERFNALMGVLESAKQEFYRTRIAPYEDCKREDNGDL